VFRREVFRRADVSKVCHGGGVLLAFALGICSWHFQTAHLVSSPGKSAKRV
jgi:hypothetical protein